MLTTLKNWWKGYKIVQLSNGKWIVFVRSYVGWKALDKDTPRDHQWSGVSLIQEYCLCNSEEQAVEVYASYKKRTVADEIKAHL